MFGSLGAPELMIIAGVIVLIFGVGKISGLGRELGSSIKEFRRAVKDGEEEGAEGEAPKVQAQVQEPDPTPPPVQQAQASAPPPPPAQPTQAPPPTETASTDGKSSDIF